LPSGFHIGERSLLGIDAELATGGQRQTCGKASKMVECGMLPPPLPYSSSP
jgi:hypothetical protein